MSDMTKMIEAKSDQLNADDLLAGPITVRIRDVKTKQGGEQPCWIYYDGDNDKPFKPSKSMARVLVAAWGDDSKAYIGKSMTLFRDPDVKWAGMKVGGIRISAMSGLQRSLTIALTETRGVKKLFTVSPLREVAAAEQKAEPTLEQKAAAAKKKADTIIEAITEAEGAKEIDAVFSDYQGDIERLQIAYVEQYERIIEARDFMLKSLAAQV